MPVRIILVDDHELLRDGLRIRLSAVPGLAVIGETGTARDALARLEADPPDLVILDLNLPDASGIAASTSIRRGWPAVKVLILTGSTGPAAVREALEAGADGFVFKEEAADELLRAITALAEGKSYLSPAAALALTQTLRVRPEGAAASAGPKLTERELAVLRGVAEGLTYKEIAVRLGVSAKSVETYRARLARKLGVSSKVELARYALTRGLA